MNNYQLSDSLSEVLLPPPVVVPGLLLVLVAPRLTNHPGSEQRHSSLYILVFICNNVLTARLQTQTGGAAPRWAGLGEAALGSSLLVSTL